MSAFSPIRDWWRRHRLAWWESFSLTMDDTSVRVMESAPGKPAQEWLIRWQGTRRVCFKDGGLAPDVLYVWTSGGEDPVMIPIAGAEAHRLWLELQERGLFPEELAAQAIRSTGGECYSWPPLPDPTSA